MPLQAAKGLLFNLLNFFEVCARQAATAKFWKPWYFSILHFTLTVMADLAGFLVIYYLPETHALNKTLTHGVFTVSIVLSVVFYEMTRRTDPGTIEKQPPEQAAEAHPSGLPYCQTCNTLRYLRSKHCRICDRCVYRFDHHCPWTCNCIGANNQRWYITFLIVQAINIWILSYFYISAFRFGLSSDAAWWWVFLNTWIVSLMNLAVLSLLLAHSAKLMHNITTNEMVNSSRITYLNPKVPYYNIFDLGIENNLRECFVGYSREKEKWAQKVMIPEDKRPSSHGHGHGHGHGHSHGHGHGHGHKHGGVGHVHGPNCKHGAAQV